MEDAGKIHRWMDQVAPYQNAVRCQLAAREALEADQNLGVVVVCPACEYILLDRRCDAQIPRPQHECPMCFQTFQNPQKLVANPLAPFRLKIDNQGQLTVTRIPARMPPGVSNKE